MTGIKKRIVGRVFRTTGAVVLPSLSDLFEQLIAENRQRGYQLESWQMSRVICSHHDSVDEVIIAVFIEAEKSLME